MLDRLKHEMILLTHDKHRRDWRGVFQLCQLDEIHYQTVERSRDQIIFLIISFIRAESVITGKVMTMQEFLKILQQIDRYDVYDDLKADFSE